MISVIYSIIALVDQPFLHSSPWRCAGRAIETLKATVPYSLCCLRDSKHKRVILKLSLHKILNSTVEA